jgi:hypothetical protein
MRFSKTLIFIFISIFVRIQERYDFPKAKSPDTRSKCCQNFIFLTILTIWNEKL